MISNVLQEIMLDYFNRYLQVKVTFHVVDNRTVCEKEINVEIISYFTKPLFWLHTVGLLLKCKIESFS